jgi:Amt family ammonium transporter
MITLTTMDTLWLLICLCLVVFMQAGFTCLESGSIRSKNSINVVVKNTADWSVSLLAFALFGFGIMFAPGNAFFGLPWGHSGFAESDAVLVFLIQAMFCATAVTIISGAVAERMTFAGFLSCAALIALLIYPLAGRWVWGDLFYGEQSTGWLSALGFHDYAGATVVHSVGGWVALAAILIIGPRIGRFDMDGESFEASSLPLAALGVFLLWIGWLGFNGASQLRFNDLTGSIVSITMIGGVSGVAAGLLVSYLCYGKPHVMLLLNGGLSGLVSVTGAADLLSVWWAIPVGLVGGAQCVLVSRALERAKIDDAIGVIPVHLTAGIWGTLVVAIALPLPDISSRISALGVQMLGIVTVGVMAFGLSYVALRVLNRYWRLRVSAAAEIVGLNIWEHDVSTSNLEIIKQMAAQANSGDFDRYVSVQPHTEASHIASFYNAVLDKFNGLQQEKDALLAHAQWLSDRDHLTGIFNRRAVTRLLDKEFSRVRRHGGHACVAILDIDHFKKVNDKHGHDVGDEAIKLVANTLTENLREHDGVGRLGGEEFCLLMPETKLPEAVTAMDKVRQVISAVELKAGSQPFTVTVSIGVASLTPEVTVEQALKAADVALYKAKSSGRDQVMSSH